MTSTVKTVFIVMGACVATFLLWTLFFRASNTVAGKTVKGGAVTYAEMQFEVTAADYYEKYCFVPNSALYANFSSDKYLKDSDASKPTIDDCFTSNKIKFQSIVDNNVENNNTQP